MPHHDRRHDLPEHVKVSRPRSFRVEYRISDECCKRLGIARERHHQEEISKHCTELAEVLPLATMPPSLAVVAVEADLFLFLIGVLQIAPGSEVQAEEIGCKTRVSFGSV